MTPEEKAMQATALNEQMQEHLLDSEEEMVDKAVRHYAEHIDNPHTVQLNSEFIVACIAQVHTARVMARKLDRKAKKTVNDVLTK